MDQSPFNSYALEHLFSYRLTQQPPEVIGPVAEGFRISLYPVGGNLLGPRLRGRIVPVGGDWVTVRTDGVALMDFRITFETDDGALIYFAFPGMLEAGEDGYQALLRGEIPTAGLPFRCAPRFQTAHPAYQWLNRIQGLGVGQVFLDRNEILLDVYAVN